MAHEPPQTPGTMSNLQVLAHVAALDALGVDIDRVLEVAGLSRETFADPKGRIDANIDVRLWDASIAVAGDPALGLRAGRHISYEALGGYGYLLQHSATPRQLFAHADKYIRLMDDLARIETREVSDRIIVRVFRSGGYAICGPAIDCLFAAVMTVTRESSPHLPVADVRVRIAHRSALDAATYAELLGCPVEVGAEHNELDFPLAWADVPNPSADAKLAEVLRDHAAYLIETLPDADQLLQDARTKLAAQLAAGDASLATLARAMHMSERTLRRRLADRGTSFQSLLDALRCALACKLVEQAAQSVDAIAHALGFADTSSFFHAFKRWTGKTPAQYRREQRGDR